MNKLLIFFLFVFIPFIVFSQKKKYQIKTNGYYYTENKKLKKDFIKLDWLSSARKNDTIYSISPIIMDSLGNFSTSDDYYGIILKKNNSFTSSHLLLEETLKKRSTLFTKGKYCLNEKNITFTYYLPMLNKIELKGIVISDSCFVINEKNIYKNNDLIRTNHINNKFIYKNYFIKKENYLDEELTKFSLDEYDKLYKNKPFFEFKYDSETAFVYVKIPREKAGRIKKKTFKEIKENLEKISKSKIDSSKTIIINYFPAEDKCQGKRKWNSFFINKCKNYLKKIRKKDNIAQFFIFKDKNVIKNFNKYFNSYIDEDLTIEKTFFKFHYPCFSYVIIRPNGNYYTYRGEYNISTIPNKL